MESVSRRTFLGVSSAAAGLALLDACGGSTTPTLTVPAPSAQPALSPATVAAGSAPAASATNTGTTATKQIVMAISVDPVSLDPRQTQVTEAFSLTHVVNEELLFRDEKGTIIPSLATGWEYTKDTELTLRLKTGLKFDNGEPYDADAVKYSLESIMDPANSFIAPEKRGWLASVDHIDVVDPATVKITTKAPNHALVSYLGLIGVVPPKAAKAAGDAYGNTPSGTGPYKLVKYTPGDRLVYQARSDYWGGTPKTEQVVVRFIKEDATRVAALEAGEVQVVENVPPDSLARIKNNAKLEIISVPSVRAVFVGFMMDRPPFNNIDLRHAILHAIDRQAIVDKVLAGYGQVAESMFAPGVAFFKPQSPYPYDPDKAKALIKQSGFNTAQTLKFAYPNGRTINDKAVGEAVGAMLQSVGLTLQLDSPEWGTYLDNYQKRRIYDFVIASMGPVNLDPDYALFPWFRSDTSWLKYSNPMVDDMLQKGAKATDPKVEEGIYADLQTFLWQDLPYAPLYIVPQLWAKAKSLTGFQLRPDSLWLFNNAAVQ